MHWQIACSESTNKTAVRFDAINNRNVYRHISGSAYYHNQIGEYKPLMESQVRGYSDWEPDNPKVKEAK